MPSCDPGGVAAGGSSGTDEPASRTVPSAVGAKLRTGLTLRWGASCPGSPSGLGAQLCYVCGPDGGEGPQRPPCGRGARDARPGAVASGDQLRGALMGMGGPVTQAPSMGRPLERHQGHGAGPASRRCSWLRSWASAPEGLSSPGTWPLGGGPGGTQTPADDCAPRASGGPGTSPRAAESPSPMLSGPSILPRGPHWVRAL